MAKKRIGSFSKECQIKFDEMLEILHKLGYDKYHSNLQMIDEDIQNKVLEYLTDPTQLESRSPELPSDTKEETPPSEVEKKDQGVAKPYTDITGLDEEDLEAKVIVKGREVKVDKKVAKKESNVDILKKNLKKSKTEVTDKKETASQKVLLKPGMTIKEVADAFNVRETEVIKKLFLKGILATINRPLELETAQMLAEEYGIEIEVLKTEAISAEKDAKEEIGSEEQEQLQLRPPIVTIMGHVDHGKTSLLDLIRKTKVTEEEVGGITQKIGAYNVNVNGRSIVFLDTPGHEAFTAMRARGAKATDIAILVVAADDGVMPQTKEAISHAKAANVPIIIAINKIDKANANPDRVKQQLAENGLLIEEWGGDIVAVPVSAKAQTGIDELLEMILLVADIQEFKANPNRSAEGVIIESRLDRGKGPVATVLIHNGTLHIGDYFVVGNVCGKVKNLLNDRGKHVTEAGPSIPVEVMGLTVVPKAGDTFKVITEKDARLMAKQGIITECSLPAMTWRDKVGLFKELCIVLKADFQGSLEAIQQAIAQIDVETTQVRIIHSGIGDISEADVLLAKANDALLVGFSVKPDVNARAIASTEQVEIRLYNIIFKLLEDLEKALKGLLEPEMEEVTIGKAEIRAIFKIGKLDAAAGCYVTEGKILRSASIKIHRNDEIVFEGKISSLKRFKDDVKEVASGYECGMSFDGFKDIEERDIVEAYILQKKKIII